MHNSNCERGLVTCERNSLADTKIIGEGEKGGDPGVRAEIPPQSIGNTIVTKVDPCSPWRTTLKQIFTSSCGNFRRNHVLTNKKCLFYLQQLNNQQDQKVLKNVLLTLQHITDTTRIVILTG